MAMPDRAGRFRAHPVETGVSFTGENKLATFIVRYRCVEFFDEGGKQWVPWAEYGHEITGYHYLDKKDGNVNERTIRDIREAFGWDGVSIESLQGDWSDALVQINIAEETYNGKTSLRVKWLNPADYEGGGAIEKSDAATLKALSNKLGPKLRAVASPAVAARQPGGKPTPPPAATAAPSAPAAPPAAPAPTSAPKRQPRPVNPDVAAGKPCTKDECWAEFLGDHTNPKTVDKIAEEFLRIVGEMTNNAPHDQITSEEWGVIRRDGPEQLIPF